MSYAEKSRQKDFDQHASKIRLGLQNLTNDDAKRAIWELFQNAVDLSDNCHIRITHTLNGLKFEHNGAHFDEDSLSSLIKQVTNKVPGTTEEQVGQYGTGFITTHIYGKVIELNGYVKIEDGFIPLKNFIIDRKDETEAPLNRKILDQDNKAADIISAANGKVAVADPNAFTSFHYLSEQHNLDNVDTAIEYLKEVLPLVFVFNDRLAIVELNTNTASITFKKKEIVPKEGYFVVNVSKNEEDISFVCLFSEDSKRRLRIILPYNEKLQEDNNIGSLPKLFLFYPLIGTEHNGTNFIIHSHGFLPKEKRNALYLEFDNEDIKKDVEKNRKIINESFGAVLTFLKNNPSLIPDSLALCKIHLSQIQTGDDNLDFWEKGKATFVDELIDIKIINTLKGRSPISAAVFFHHELLKNPESLQSIYSIASQFWTNLPEYTDVFSWSMLVQSWNNPKINLIGIDDILKKVEQVGELNGLNDTEEYRRLLLYVIKHSNTDWFDTYSILPNHYGRFHTFSQLKEPVSIDTQLIKIAEELFSNIPESFIDPSFKLDRPLPLYDRSNFKTSINDKAAEINDRIEKGEDIKFNKIKALLDYCSINTTTEINKLLCPHLASFYEIILPYSTINDHVKDFDYRSSLKTVFKYFIFDITQRGCEWIKQHIKVLIQAHKIVYQNDDFKRSLLHEIKAYPNQNYELCSQKSIKVDAGIPRQLKEIYLEITKIDIKEQLALNEVSQYMHEPGNITPDQLGSELEKIFHNDKIKYTEITSNPYKDRIISIVELITKDELPWKVWFATLNSYRLEVLVGKIIDPYLRSSMFSILTKNDRTISLLGNLAEIENLQEIVDAGKQKIEQDQQTSSSFRHKHLIGTLIEEIIREKVSDIVGLSIDKPEYTLKSIDEISTKEEQNGQDIIIYLNNKPVYLIEVKSRWNENTPFRISRNQTIKAFENVDKYALVSVDMVQYKGGDKHGVTSIDQISEVVKVNIDIGEKLQREMIDLYKSSKDNALFHIDGDFRTYIPFTFIDSGKSIDAFEEHLIKELRKAYAQQN